MKNDALDYAKATRLVGSWKRPVLFSHVKPDGDALGGLAALRSLLVGRGADPVAVLYDELPERYRSLWGEVPFVQWSADVAGRLEGQADGIVIVDTCARGQLEPVVDWIQRSPLSKIAVDHHVSRDVDADVFLIDERAAAACLIVYHWARSAGWSIDDDAMNSLFLGIATDTGWFRFSNTDGDVLRAAAELSAAGVKPARLAQLIYESDSEARVRLLGEAIASMELHCDGRFALMAIPSAMMKRVGAEYSDTESIVNEPLRISSVCASAVLVGRDGEPVRMSFRSKEPFGSDCTDVDVSSIARRFGGGGHRRAAGARSTLSLEDARAQVVACVQKALDGTG